jgi:hypothetical protein
MKITPYLLLAIASTASSVNAFTPSQRNARSNSLTEIQSTVVPAPTRDVIRQQQPELGEADLYVNPPVRNPPVPGSIMKMLPKNTFDIDTPTSLFYFGIDLLAVVATMGFLDIVVTSANYHALPMWAQALCVAPLQVLTGFAMW